MVLGKVKLFTIFIVVSFNETTSTYIAQIDILHEILFHHLKSGVFIFFCLCLGHKF